MFCQLHIKEKSQIVISSPKKLKNRNNKNKRKVAKRKDLKFVKSMSMWAENFATAATWQLKHQVAYWKARATALEYENKVLHDVIRRNHSEASTNECEMKTESEHGNDSEDGRVDHQNHQDDFDDQDENLEDHNDQQESEDSDNQETENRDDDDQCENDEIEVSDEFIQFLIGNMKFKEDARMERERLRAKEEEKEVVEEPRETFEERRERMKALYGDKWQRIWALEVSMETKFFEDCNTNKPVYWPNIPLNFNF